MDLEFNIFSEYIFTILLYSGTTELSRSSIKLLGENVIHTRSPVNLIDPGIGSSRFSEYGSIELSNVAKDYRHGLTITINVYYLLGTACVLYLSYLYLKYKVKHKVKYISVSTDTEDLHPHDTIIYNSSILSSDNDTEISFNISLEEDTESENENIHDSEYCVTKVTEDPPDKFHEGISIEERYNQPIDKIIHTPYYHASNYPENYDGFSKEELSCEFTDICLLDDSPGKQVNTTHQEDSSGFTEICLLNSIVQDYTTNGKRHYPPSKYYHGNDNSLNHEKYYYYQKF